MLFGARCRSGTDDELPSRASNEMRGETAIASPGASSHRDTRTMDITTMATMTNHDTVTNGIAVTSQRALPSPGADGTGGGRGTLSFVMVSWFMFGARPILAVSTAGTTVRALWVCALALLALAAVSKMKPATPRRPAVVRVEQRPVPLAKAPDRNHVRRALATLAGGSVVLGATLACAAGFALAVLLSLVGDLLRS
jgi:hypothetical protein